MWMLSSHCKQLHPETDLLSSDNGHNTTCTTSPQGLQNLRAVEQAAREECGPVALARTPAGGESAPRGHGSGVVVLSTGVINSPVQRT